MSVSSFSSHNITLHPSLLSSFSNSSLYPIPGTCYQYASAGVIFPVFTLTNVLILVPLHILVLYMGVQQWRNQCSVGGVIRISHTDFFTYHLVTVNGFGVLALVFFSYGICTDSEEMITVAVCVFCMFFPGRALFDCLTCVERYLAVVHPIIYFRQREKGAVRIRNISTGCVWLLCFGCLGIGVWYSPFFPTIPFLCLLGFSIFTVLYCSLAVLRILIRPGPGEVGRERDGFDQLKKKAFRIIMTILGTLLSRFLGLFLCFGLSNLVSVHEDTCLLMNSAIWLTLPSSLALPLLFLQRAGKLPCFR